MSSPVICFALFELLLVVVGYGNAYPLVKTERIHGKEKYVTNREVGRRYFSLPPDKIPDAANEYFNAQKQPNELRILCLGGSTTAGFPYEHNATFRAVNWTYHENALPFLMIGDLFKSQGRGEEAHWYYQKAAERNAYRRRDTRSSL